MKNKNSNIGNNELIISPLADVVGECFARYAKYIILDRALPDIRDGLKPVQRRILYAMYELGLAPDKPYKKSARTVGEVIGKYHPHGDSSIYEAMVRMSQNWKNNLPLLDMHGNNGSIDGDSAAAMRYTECRLSNIAYSMLENIKNETVDFVFNFDDSEKEPSILPSLFPNLLINGAVGIAAGYATNIPTFNPSEVFECAIAMIDNPSMTINDILKIMPGPDFPTGGIIENKQGIIDFYQTGKGKFFITSKIDIDSENNQIIVSEIPYDTNKLQIVKEINEIIINEKISGIDDVKDLSDKDGIRIVIDCRKDKNLVTIKNYLLKNTHLQISYVANFVAIVERKPVLLSIDVALANYIKYAISIQLKVAKYNLKKAQERFEVVNGLIIAINNISEVIEIIRQSHSKQAAEFNLIKRFGFTDRQADAVVSLRLYRLSQTDIGQFLSEANRLEHYINELLTLINSDELQKIALKQKILDYKSKYQLARRTNISDVVNNLQIDIMDAIDIQDMYVFVSRDGYIKTVSCKTFDSNSYIDIGHARFDFVFFGAKCKTNDYIIICTKFGKVITLPIYKIKSCKWRDVGNSITSFTSFNPSDKIVSCHIVNNLEDKEIIFVTKMGYIKKTPLSDVANLNLTRPNSGIKLKNDDHVIFTKIITINENYFISLINNKTNAYAFSSADIPLLQKNTMGVKTMKLRPNEYLVAVLATKTLTLNCCLIMNNNLLQLPMMKIPVSNIRSLGKPLILKFNGNLIFAHQCDKNTLISAITNDNEMLNISLHDDSIAKTLLDKNIVDASIIIAQNDIIEDVKKAKILPSSSSDMQTKLPM